MPTLLLIVEDTFQISGWGLVVVPGPRIHEYSGPGSARVELRKVELRKPDGAVAFADATIQRWFQTPPPNEHRWSVVFPSLRKGDVPVGTEIRLVET